MYPCFASIVHTHECKLEGRGNDGRTVELVGERTSKKKVYKGVEVMAMVIPEQKDFVYN